MQGINIIDAIIIIFLGFGAVIGFKRGFIKQTVMSVGLVAIIIIAYMLKNPLSSFMYERMPFLNFEGVWAGITVMNILFYEMAAFFIVLAVLTVIFRIIIGISSVAEKILDFTVVLGIISKILGAIMGLVESYIIIFLALFIMSLPMFNLEFLDDSNFKPKILEETPIISKASKSTITTITELNSLRSKYTGTYDKNQLNIETLDLMLKNKIITVDGAKKLYESGKLEISGVNQLFEKYSGASND